MSVPDAVAVVSDEALMFALVVVEVAVVMVVMVVHGAGPHVPLDNIEPVPDVIASLVDGSSLDVVPSVERDVVSLPELWGNLEPGIVVVSHTVAVLLVDQVFVVVDGILPRRSAIRSASVWHFCTHGLAYSDHSDQIFCLTLQMHSFTFG